MSYHTAPSELQSQSELDAIIHAFLSGAFVPGAQVDRYHRFHSANTALNDYFLAIKSKLVGLKQLTDQAGLYEVLHTIQNDEKNHYAFQELNRLLQEKEDWLDSIRMFCSIPATKTQYYMFISGGTMDTEVYSSAPEGEETEAHTSTVASADYFDLQSTTSPRLQQSLQEELARTRLARRMVGLLQTIKATPQLTAHFPLLHALVTQDRAQTLQKAHGALACHLDQARKILGSAASPRTTLKALREKVREIEAPSKVFAEYCELIKNEDYAILAKQLECKQTEIQNNSKAIAAKINKIHKLESNRAIMVPDSMFGKRDALLKALEKLAKPEAKQQATVESCKQLIKQIAQQQCHINDLEQQLLPLFRNEMLLKEASRYIRKHCFTMETLEGTVEVLPGGEVSDPLALLKTTSDGIKESLSTQSTDKPKSKKGATLDDSRSDAEFYTHELAEEILETLWALKDTGNLVTIDTENNISSLLLELSNTLSSLISKFFDLSVLGLDTESFRTLKLADLYQRMVKFLRMCQFALENEAQYIWETGTDNDRTLAPVIDCDAHGRVQDIQHHWPMFLKDASKNPISLTDFKRLLSIQRLALDYCKLYAKNHTHGNTLVLQAITHGQMKVMATLKKSAISLCPLQERCLHTMLERGIRVEEITKDGKIIWFDDKGQRHEDAELPYFFQVPRPTEDFATVTEGHSDDLALSMHKIQQILTALDLARSYGSVEPTAALKNAIAAMRSTDLLPCPELFRKLARDSNDYISLEKNKKYPKGLPKRNRDQFYQFLQNYRRFIEIFDSSPSEANKREAENCAYYALQVSPLNGTLNNLLYLLMVNAAKEKYKNLEFENTQYSTHLTLEADAYNSVGGDSQHASGQKPQAFTMHQGTILSFIETALAKLTDFHQQKDELLRVCQTLAVIAWYCNYLNKNKLPIPPTLLLTYARIKDIPLCILRLRNVEDMGLWKPPITQQIVTVGENSVPNKPTIYLMLDENGHYAHAHLHRLPAHIQACQSTEPNPLTGFNSLLSQANILSMSVRSDQSIEQPSRTNLKEMLESLESEIKILCAMNASRLLETIDGISEKLIEGIVIPGYAKPRAQWINIPVLFRFHFINLMREHKILLETKEYLFRQDKHRENNSSVPATTYLNKLDDLLQTFQVRLVIYLMHWLAIHIPNTYQDLKSTLGSDLQALFFVIRDEIEYTSEEALDKIFPIPSTRLSMTFGLTPEINKNFLYHLSYTLHALIGEETSTVRTALDNDDFVIVTRQIKKFLFALTNIIQGDVTPLTKNCRDQDQRDFLSNIVPLLQWIFEFRQHIPAFMANHAMDDHPVVSDFRHYAQHMVNARVQEVFRKVAVCNAYLSAGSYIYTKDYWKEDILISAMHSLSGVLDSAFKATQPNIDYLTQFRRLLSPYIDGEEIQRPQFTQATQSSTEFTLGRVYPPAPFRGLIQQQFEALLITFRGNNTALQWSSLSAFLYVTTNITSQERTIHYARLESILRGLRNPLHIKQVLFPGADLGENKSLEKHRQQLAQLKDLKQHLMRQLLSKMMTPSDDFSYVTPLIENIFMPLLRPFHHTIGELPNPYIGKEAQAQFKELLDILHSNSPDELKRSKFIAFFPVDDKPILESRLHALLSQLLFSRYHGVSFFQQHLSELCNEIPQKSTDAHLSQLPLQAAPARALALAELRQVRAETPAITQPAPTKKTSTKKKRLTDVESQTGHAQIVDQYQYDYKKQLLNDMCQRILETERQQVIKLFKSLSNLEPEIQEFYIQEYLSRLPAYILQLRKLIQGECSEQTITVNPDTGEASFEDTTHRQIDLRSDSHSTSSSATDDAGQNTSLLHRMATLLQEREKFLESAITQLNFKDCREAAYDAATSNVHVSFIQQYTKHITAHLKKTFTALNTTMKQTFDEINRQQLKEAKRRAALVEQSFQKMEEMRRKQQESVRNFHLRQKDELNTLDDIIRVLSGKEFDGNKCAQTAVLTAKEMKRSREDAKEADAASVGLSQLLATGGKRSGEQRREKFDNVHLHKLGGDQMMMTTDSRASANKPRGTRTSTQPGIRRRGSRPGVFAGRPHPEGQPSQPHRPPRGRARPNRVRAGSKPQAVASATPVADPTALSRGVTAPPRGRGRVRVRGPSPARGIPHGARRGGTFPPPNRGRGDARPTVATTASTGEIRRPAPKRGGRGGAG